MSSVSLWQGSPAAETESNYLTLKAKAELWTYGGRLANNNWRNPVRRKHPGDESPKGEFTTTSTTDIKHLEEKPSWRTITGRTTNNQLNSQYADYWRPVDIYLEEGECKLKVVGEVWRVYSLRDSLLKAAAGKLPLLCGCRKTTRV